MQLESISDLFLNILQLKKVINSVAQELNSAGLEAHVLKQLLATDGLESSDKTLLAGIEHARAEYELQGKLQSMLSFCLFLRNNEGVPDLVQQAAQSHLSLASGSP